MDFTTISTFITSVGFPIVACYAMFKYISNTQAKFDETLDKNNIILTELTTLIKQLIDNKK